MRIQLLALYLTLSTLLAACADPPAPAYTEHETAEDFIVEKSGVRGLPGAFDRNHVMDDDFLVDDQAAGEAEVQAFLEDTPYGSRCFLADERVGGVSAAAAIVEGARTEGINPIVLLARMQVERSMIGKSRRPATHDVDFAFGCGCPDGQACDAGYRGLGKQVTCAARTLRRHFDGSIDGTSPFVRGQTRRSLDGLRVTPSNDATASLYSYTPWVLPNRGGNWLVWNITVKFARAFADRGPVAAAPAPAAPTSDAPPPPSPSPDAPAPVPTLHAQWIGDACSDDSSCRFADGSSGICQPIPGSPTGMCTVSCEGLCPDLAEHGSTFCISSGFFGAASDVGGGLCARKSQADNNFCAATPGLAPRTANRYVGNSSAAARSAEVCVPGQ